MFILFFRNLRYPFRTSLCGNPYRPIGVFKLAWAGWSRPSLFILVFKVNIIFVWFGGGGRFLLRVWRYRLIRRITVKKNHISSEIIAIFGHRQRDIVLLLYTDYFVNIDIPSDILWINIIFQRLVTIVIVLVVTTVAWIINVG